MGDRKDSVYSACLAATVVLTTGHAFAHGGRTHHHAAPGSSARTGHHHHHASATRVSYRHHAHANVQYAYRAHVIQCVAFAKQDAGILISGNARDWWERAAGIYERGSRPEAGSVLSFRSIGRMPLGHVAVVSGMIDSRTILIDQSHWNSGGITRDIQVKDVSENNDWSAVRVQLSHGGAFGSIYPTHGFIYPRPDRGVVEASASGDVLTPRVVPAVTRRAVLPAAMEVAEAPTTGKALDLRLQGITFDAPNRAWR